jgi:predicted RecB family nuclease
VLQRLSKSRFVAGLQCHRLLWWRVHEPDAPELVPTPLQQGIFDRGTRVGEHARGYVPGGVLIERDRERLDEAVEATKAALRAKPPAIYEAAFLADGAFVAVDILERTRGGWNLVEVKSATRLKDEHVPDVALQLHVLETAGMTVRRAEVMVLNRACAHPDLSDLFRREDVTQRARALRLDVVRGLADQRESLAGPLPEVAIGDHCHSPYPCPFLGRCWPKLPEHHVSTLYLGRQSIGELLAQGHETLQEVPEAHPLRPIQRRQVRAVKEDRMIVEEGLARALREIDGDRAYLDFETLAPAIPRWPGCHPYDAVPAQFVSFVRRGSGEPRVVSYLAEGGGDPREPLALRLLEALDGVPLVLAWYATYEKTQIRALARALPHLEGDLLDLESRVVDLLEVVRDHVYHPAFGGSFSLKHVLPTLVPELAYDDLEIRDGVSASLVLERLMLEPELLSADETARLRRALDAYCRRDTWGLVALHDRLEQLATPP